jgi:hypothetical protein
MSGEHGVGADGDIPRSLSDLIRNVHRVGQNLGYVLNAFLNAVGAGDPILRLLRVRCCHRASLSCWVRVRGNPGGTVVWGRGEVVIDRAGVAGELV